MVHPRSTHKVYHYSPFEGFEVRCVRRLQEDLGVDEGAAEAILHLRAQVMELQSRIRELETELDAHFEDQQARLGRHLEEYSEATWIEIEIEE